MLDHDEDPTLADEDEEEGQSTSSPRKKQRDRYRRQRDEALNLVKQLAENQEALAARLDGLISTLGERQTKNSEEEPSDPWARMSESELSQLLSSEEISEKPQLGFTALLKYFDKKLTGMGEKLKTDIRDSVLGETTREQLKSAVFDKLRESYGDEIFDPSSELNRAVAKQFNALKRRYGEKTVDTVPEFYLLAAQLAAEQLGVEPRARPASGEEEPTKPTGSGMSRPSKDALQSGGSEGAPSRGGMSAKERLKLLRKGDTRTVLKSLLAEAEEKGAVR